MSTAELYSVVSNEYANRNYVLDNDDADDDGNSSMNYDDIDEIDTNNMAIYGVQHIKKEKVDKPMMRTRQQTGAAESASVLQQQFKQEPMDSVSTGITSNRRKGDRTAGKSLLISSKPKNIQEDSNVSSSEAAADMMINLINEQQQQQQQLQQQKPVVDQALPTTSTAVHPQGLRNRQDSFLLQNELPQALFEENSQVIT